MRARHVAPTLALASVVACTAPVPDGAPRAAEENPFLADQTGPAKADTAYMNPDGREVEVDLEGELPPELAGQELMPAILGQFAVTYFRERRDFYLESLAEDFSSRERVEWRVGDGWMSMRGASEAGIPRSSLTRFRIQRVNAVLLLEAMEGVDVGSVFEAEVPASPVDLMQRAGETCANDGGDIHLDESVYWYLWNPDKEGCEVETRPLTVTVSALVPTDPAPYPEYDRLVEDGLLSIVVLFGQIGHDELTENDPGFGALRRMAKWLEGADFEEVAGAPVGRRLEKAVGDVRVEFDLYAPSDFAGLGDHAHFENLQRAIAEHEIVVYDGHSMLGASSFWRDLDYPATYQIFFYGGCLGYEYYVRPIVTGKGGWEDLDLVSSVVEVSDDAPTLTARLFAKLFWALENDYQASWRDLILTIRDHLGDSTFGVSGVRDNRFRPVDPG